MPTPPLNLSANASSATSIQLAWSQPISLNGALHGYRIRYKPLSASNYGTPIIAGTQLTYNVMSLKPFTYYELQVCQSSIELLKFAIMGYYGLLDTKLQIFLVIFYACLHNDS